MSIGTGRSREPLGVILNAGLGTRLRPITPGLPKAMIPVLNRPLIDYAIESLVLLGIREISVVVAPGDGASGPRALAVAPPGVTIHVAVQAEPNGIGGAIVSVGEHLDGRDVAVLAADTLLVNHGHNYLREFGASKACAGLLLAPVADPRSFGVAGVVGNRVVDLEEKPQYPRSNLAVVGLWVLGNEAIQRVRLDPVINGKGESDLTATVAQLLEEGREILGWQLSGEWLDAGTVDGLLNANLGLLRSLKPDSMGMAAGCAIDGTVSLASGALARDSQLRGPVLLGAGASVVNSELDCSVVGEGASVRGSILERCVVLPGAHVQGGRYRDVVFTPSGAVAGPGVQQMPTGVHELRSAVSIPGP